MGRAIPNAVPFVAAPNGSGPRHMAFHSSDDVLYVNGELDGSICSHALNPAGGQLRALDRARILAEPANVALWAAELWDRTAVNSTLPHAGRARLQSSN